MKLPISWLKDYTNVNVSPKEYCDKMTMSGSKVEGYEQKGENIDKVVVGKILEIDKHPDADKLKICKIDVGSEVLQIVTGAPNVSEGDVVPVALVGAKLPGGNIKLSKLRGVESYGMLCSTEELEISDEPATGVLILEDKYPLGMDIKEALELNDCVVEFEITSNRPDCMGVIGIARETAATLGEDFKIPEFKVTENNENINDYLKVNVLDSELCPRYIARVIKNVKIEPSPQWLQNRLSACGVRPINNIVDITNYIMLEYCQPMHAFDIRDLSGSEINVRRAKNNEGITTLDGIERKLDDSMLVICDGEKPVAVAGVMGGENSEIKDDTTTVVFESANFMGSSIRKTAQKLGLRTESSGRYEKGLPAVTTKEAVEKACALVCMLGAGEVVGGSIDVDNVKTVPTTLKLRADYINNFLGIDATEDEMKAILEKIGFTVSGDMITAPDFRVDIESEADVAEEIARFYGYDKIKATLLKGETTQGIKTDSQKAEDAVIKVCIANGFYETSTYSFIGPKLLDKINLPADSALRNCVNILNPLGEENSIMRTTVLPSMLQVLSYNYNRRVESPRFFEIGKIYIKNEDSALLPEEKNIVTLGAYGDFDFYNLKGAVENILAEFGITKFDVAPISDNPSYHPGKTAGIYIGKMCIGCFGAVHPMVLKNYDMETEAFVAELDFNSLMKYSNNKKSYKGLPKFPSVDRDIAMLADKEILSGDIEKLIRKAGGSLLEKIKLFDVYEGKQVPEGKKSLAYTLTLRSDAGTLKEEEINSVVNKILTLLKDKLNVELR